MPARHKYQLARRQLSTLRQSIVEVGSAVAALQPFAKQGMLTSIMKSQQISQLRQPGRAQGRAGRWWAEKSQLAWRRVAGKSANHIKPRHL